jgi:hypothetical protein
MLTGSIQNGNGAQTQTAWAPWIRDLAQMLETSLAEVQHQGELKPQHPEPLSHGRLLHTMINWKNMQASALQAYHATAHQPTRLPHACWPTGMPGLQCTGLPDCSLLTSPPTHQLPSTTGGLQDHQMEAQNLPKRWRQAGLYAKGRTPELIRLKFYCS